MTFLSVKIDPRAETLCFDEDSLRVFLAYALHFRV